MNWLSALEYLKKAVDLDPKNVKPQAAAQDHFQWLHGDADFQKLVILRSSHEIRFYPVHRIPGPLP